MKDKILIVSGGRVPTKNNIDMKRINELKQLILKYDKQYYEEGVSDISDAEYDRLYEEYLSFEEKYPELKNMDDAPSKRVGAGEYAGAISGLPKYTHKSPLLSINRKSKELEDLKVFYESIGGDGTEVIIEPKLDGITCNINYEDGNFVNAATRGNGYIGDLITQNFQNTKTSYPKDLQEKASLEIRGEAIISYDFFKKNLSKDYSNPRNAVAGLMRSLNPEDVKDKGIQVMFYDIGKTHQIRFDDKDDNNIKFIKQLEFDSIPVLKATSWQELKLIVESKFNKRIKEIDGFNVLVDENYPQAVCDGLVIKVNSLSKRKELGMTEKGPRWAFAYKFKPLQTLTRIDHIEWQVGKTGKVVPVAVFDEVSLGGVKISRATLNNFEYMRNLPVIEEKRDTWIVKPYDTWGQIINVPFLRTLNGFELQALWSGDLILDTQCENLQERCKKIRIKKINKDKTGFWIDEPEEYKDKWYPFEDNRYQLVNQNKGLQMDDMIVVERSNDVIPRIVAIYHHQNCIYQQDLETSQIIQEREDSFKIPKKCPVCGHSLKKIGPQLFCQNPQCQAQLLGKMEQFVSRDGMNIVGMGSSILEELIHQGFLNEFADIYKLKKYKEEILQINKFGLRKYNNLINSIQRSMNIQLASFIYALSIPGVGKKTAKDLAKYFQSLHSFMNASYESLISIEDISDITANVILEWIQSSSSKDVVQHLLDEGINIQEENRVIENQLFNNQTFVITGTLSHPRKYYQELIEERGGKVVGSVSKKTNYVLLGKNAGSKEEKARGLINKGAPIKIINEERFLEMLKE